MVRAAVDLSPRVEDGAISIVLRRKTVMAQAPSEPGRRHSDEGARRPVPRSRVRADHGAGEATLRPCCTQPGVISAGRRSAGAVGADRLVALCGRQLRDVVDQEALHAGELVVLLGQDPHCEFFA